MFFRVYIIMMDLFYGFGILLGLNARWTCHMGGEICLNTGWKCHMDRGE